MDDTIDRIITKLRTKLRTDAAKQADVYNRLAEFQPSRAQAELVAGLLSHPEQRRKFLAEAIDFALYRKLDKCNEEARLNELLDKDFDEVWAAYHRNHRAMVAVVQELLHEADEHMPSHKNDH